MSVIAEPTTKIKVADVVENCRYSGWVRKQGGSYKSWRKRYLVLSQGCCYYFDKETATQAKGCFSLRGYRAEVGEETDKHRFVLKLLPEMCSERTYYIAFAANHELQAWLKYFTDEIGDICTHGANDETVYSAISDDEDDEEDGARDSYQIDATDPTSLKKFITAHLPQYVAPIKKGPPVPDRPLETFQNQDRPMPPKLPERGNFTGSAVSPEGDGLNGQQEDPMYLSVISGGNSIPPPRAPEQPAPVQPRKHSGGSTLSPRLAKGDSQVFSTGPPPLPQRESPVEEFDEDVENGGDSDAYYVDKEIIEQQLQTKTYQMSREEAKTALSSRAVDGMFLMRTSQHAGTQLVISVWNESECKHYKLFQDKKTGFSLTHGAAFENLMDLINHYKKENLPKSPFRLSIPYR